MELVSLEALSLRVYANLIPLTAKVRSITISIIIAVGSFLTRRLLARTVGR